MILGRSTEGIPQFLGRYNVLGQKLGIGNYATVLEAVQMDLEVHVAIKIIDTCKVRDQYVLRHLTREAALLRRLSHPNIAAIFESVRAGPLYCLVTELVPGGELSAYVSRQPGGHLAEKETMRFAGQLLSALSHMHDHGVVHRDLKMRNILLNGNQDTIKIVDFGLSNIWAPDTPLRTHCGSPGYAAPEIYILGKPYGPEVDMWSLGIVLFGMAVGRLPFPTCRDKSITPQERRRRLIAMISKGANESHDRAMNHFSPDFKDLVKRLLVAVPSQRLTIKDAAVHPWFAPLQPIICHKRYRLTARERGYIFLSLSMKLNMPVATIEEQCRVNRTGNVAAAYKILAHQHLSSCRVPLEGFLSDGRKLSNLDQVALAEEQEERKDDSTLASPTDALNSSVEQYPSNERVSMHRVPDMKSRISRLTIEPVSMIVLPACHNMKKSSATQVGPDAPSKRLNLRSIRNLSPSFGTTMSVSGFEDTDDGVATKSHRGRSTSIRTPKVVSFSTMSTCEEGIQADEVDCTKIGRTPHSQVIIKDRNDGNVQTSNDFVKASRSKRPVSVTFSLQSDQENSSSFNVSLPQVPNKSNESVDTCVGIFTELFPSEKDDKHYYTPMAEAMPRDSHSTRSSPATCGSYFATSQKESKLVQTNNELTLKSNNSDEDTYIETPSSDACSEVNLLKSAKLIRGKSQSKTLLKSTYLSQNWTCPKEVKKHSESGKTHTKTKLKKWRTVSPAYARTPSLSRYRMNIAIEKSLTAPHMVGNLQVCRSSNTPTSRDKESQRKTSQKEHGRKPCQTTSCNTLPNITKRRNGE